MSFTRLVIPLRSSSSTLNLTRTTLFIRANSTMSDHHHLQAANIFKCEGLTAVVTGVSGSAHQDSGG